MPASSLAAQISGKGDAPSEAAAASAEPDAGLPSITPSLDQEVRDEEPAAKPDASAMATAEGAPASTQPPGEPGKPETDEERSTGEVARPGPGAPAPEPEPAKPAAEAPKPPAEAAKAAAGPQGTVLSRVAGWFKRFFGS
jgi:hypothetical protein